MEFEEENVLTRTWKMYIFNKKQLCFWQLKTFKSVSEYKSEWKMLVKYYNCSITLSTECAFLEVEDGIEVWWIPWPTYVLNNIFFQKYSYTFLVPYIIQIKPLRTNPWPDILPYSALFVYDSVFVGWTQRSYTCDMWRPMNPPTPHVITTKGRNGHDLNVLYILYHRSNYKTTCPVRRLSFHHSYVSYNWLPLL